MCFFGVTAAICLAYIDAINENVVNIDLLKDDRFIRQFSPKINSFT